MKRLAAAVLVAVAGLPAAALGADPAPPAVELSRLALPEENWNKALAMTRDQLTQYVGASIAQSSGSVSPELAARIGQEFQQIMPSYHEMVDLQAGLLVKHYTEGEIRELLTFYRTPLGQKAIRIMPEVAADANAWMMATLQKRMPAMLERLKTATAQPTSQPGATAPAKEQAKKPAAGPK